MDNREHFYLIGQHVIHQAVVPNDDLTEHLDHRSRGQLYRKEPRRSDAEKIRFASLSAEGAESCATNSKML